IKLLAQTIGSLDEAVQNAAAGLKIALADATALPGLAEAFAGERRGKGRVAVVVDLGEGGEVEITLPGAYAIAAQTRMKLQTLPGITEVQEL
ncbi:hypothetical protein ACXYTC_21990, partial [Escherichia coli]